MNSYLATAVTEIGKGTVAGAQAARIAVTQAEMLLATIPTESNIDSVRTRLDRSLSNIKEQIDTIERKAALVQASNGKINLSLITNVEPS